VASNGCPGLVQQPALDAQALVQAGVAGQFDAQAAVQRALFEALVHHRATQAQRLPGQQARTGLKAETVVEAGAGAIEKYTVLRQPFQSAAGGEVKALGEPRGRADAAVELARAGHGQQGMAAGLEVDIKFEAVAGDDAPWRVQHIDMAWRTLRIERPLHQKRSDMTPRTKAGHVIALDEAQLQVGAPARVCLRWVDLLRQRHPQTPEIHGLTAG